MMLSRLAPFRQALQSPARRLQGGPLRGLSSSSKPKNDDDDGKEKRPSSAGGEQRPVRSTTMDDFFNSLGTSTASKERRPSRIRNLPKGNDNSSEASVGRSGSPYIKKSSPQFEDMRSFFDEVNKVVAENKEKEAVAAAKQEKPFQKSLFSPSPSILDLMPAEAALLGENAFDQHSHDEYIDILDVVIKDPQLMRRKNVSRLDDNQLGAVVEWLQAEEPVVQYQFPLLDQVMTAASNHNWNEEQFRIDLEGEIMAQKEKFQQQQGWNKAQYYLATRALQRLGNICAKKASGPPAEVAWEKLKEAGFCLRQDVVQNFLYVISTFSANSYSTFSTKGSVLDFLEKNVEDESNNSAKDEPLEEEVGSDLATEVALLHDILFGASEASTSIRVRKLVSQRRAAEAEMLLDSNMNEELRLRTYDPVFRCYLANKDIPAALKLYAKMKCGESVHLKPETYVQLIAGIAENGFFRLDSPPIDGALELGYEQASGPELFDRLAEELANDAVEISASAAKRLYNGMLNGFDGHDLRPLHLLQSLAVCNDAAATTELVASRVTLDETTGRCPRTGVHLRLISLDDAQKEKLKKGLQFLAKSAFEERTGKDGSQAEQNLKEFGVWLAKRKERAFTAIVDGANVGYYFQNFDEGRFNYNQIEFVVETLENMGENVLVTIPTKYTQNTFTVQKSTGPQRQTLTRKEKQIRDRLEASGKLLIVPPSYLDDYYWMYASVAGQGDKFTAEQQYIQPNNADARWPGIRPMLISNDKMRDHKLSLLEPRLFRRWYSNFIVNYTFSAFIGDQCTEKEIGFRTADFYSREIQGNKVSNEDSHCGTAWHFPVQDWEENESFCVRIPH